MDKKNFQLEKILINSNRPSSSIEIAELLGISTRTVKRKIWDLDAVLKENGASILSNKFGYAIKITDKEQFDRYWKEQLKITNELSIDDDVTLKIIELLLVNCYITQDEISSKLFISRGTINKYIKYVKSILEKEKIFLSNRPHYGYYLIANEIDIRNYMVKLFFKDENKMEKYNSVLMNKFNKYPLFYKDLIKILIEYDYTEQESKTQYLIKYIIVIINRNLNHNYIGKLESQIYVSRISQTIALKIQELIKQYLGFEIDRNELVYISYLLGNNFQSKDNIKEYDTNFFEQLIDEIFREINEVYQQDFSTDETLRKGLMQHLITSYSQLYIKAQLGNPFISLIKSQYIEAYNYAVLCGSILHQRYDLDVSEDNLAYIAMHFGAAIERIESNNKYKAIVVCESGCGTAEMFRARLKNRISSLEIISVTSIKNLKDINLNEIILIISSVPLPKTIKKPLIIVNPLLLEQDIEKIKEYLSDYRNINEYNKLFCKELFFPQMYVKSKEELLNNICDEMINKNILNKSNKKDIINREMLSSTEINKYVAIPHCIIDSGNKTNFTIVTLKKPIQWGKGEARLIFIGAIARNSMLNKKIFPLLYKLTMDTEKIESLCKMKNFEEFIQKLFSELPVEYTESGK